MNEKLYSKQDLLDILSNIGERAYYPSDEHIKVMPLSLFDSNFQRVVAMDHVKKIIMKNVNRDTK